MRLSLLSAVAAVAMLSGSALADTATGTGKPSAPACAVSQVDYLHEAQKAGAVGAHHLDADEATSLLLAVIVKYGEPPANLRPHVLSGALLINYPKAGRVQIVFMDEGCPKLSVGPTRQDTIDFMNAAHVAIPAWLTTGA